MLKQSLLLLFLSIWASELVASIPISATGTSYETCGTIRSPEELAQRSMSFIGRVVGFTELSRYQKYSVSFEVERYINAEGESDMSEVVSLNYVANKPVQLFVSPLRLGERYVIFSDGTLLDICNGAFSGQDFAVDILTKISDTLELDFGQSMSNDNSGYCSQLQFEDFDRGGYNMLYGTIRSIESFDEDRISFVVEPWDGGELITLFTISRNSSLLRIESGTFVVYDDNLNVPPCMIGESDLESMTPIRSALFAYAAYLEV